MKFEIAERIDTDRDRGDVLTLAIEQFRKVSESVKQKDDGSFIARSIEATFGSINRTDETIVSINSAGWRLAVDRRRRVSSIHHVLGIRNCCAVFVCRVGDFDYLLLGTTQYGKKFGSGLYETRR